MDINYDSKDFNHGASLGRALGEQKAYREAQAAYDAGEIELWLAYNRPKTFEGWEAWEAEHGPHSEFKTRWLDEDDE